MKPNIVVSWLDLERLERILDRLPAAQANARDALLSELERAEMVEPWDMPPDVVTMNSTVRLRDLTSGEAVTYTLVYPARADISEDRISVLAPVGTAILGYREGDTIEWSVPSGLKRLKVEQVLYQPERAGAFDL